MNDIKHQKNKPTILLFSAKAQHGKDTCVDYALDYYNNNNKKVKRVAFGDYVKFIGKQYYGWDGEKDEDGRTLLHEVGDEGRKVNVNIWVDMAMLFVETFCYDCDYILISDFRFENEIERLMLHKYKTFSFRVNRPNFDNGLTIKQQKHISETDLDNYCNFDFIIDNDGAEEDLQNKVVEILENKI